MAIKTVASWLALTVGVLPASGCLVFETSGTGGTSSSSSQGTGGDPSGSGGGTGGGGPTLTSSSASSGGGGAASEVEHFACPLDDFPADRQLVYGNGTDEHELTSDQTWTKDNLYIVQGAMTVFKKLTIEAGTIVCFAYYPPNDADGQLTVGSDGLSSGSLVIEGTPSEHVVLTSAGGDDDYWIGVNGGSYEAITWKNVDVYNASRGGGSGWGAFRTLFPDSPAVALENVTFHSLNAGGIRLKNRSGLSAGSSVTIASYSDNAGIDRYAAVETDPAAASSLTADTIHFGSGIPEPHRIALIPDSDLFHPATWHDIGVPFVLRSSFSIRQLGFDDPVPVLTIEPGVVVKLDRSILVGGQTGDPGGLVAVGTAEAPVVFTTSGDAEAPAGRWGSIYFNGTGATSKLAHVRLEHGGNPDPWDQSVANCHDPAGPNLYLTAEVTVTGIGAAYAGPVIVDTTFESSGGDGVRARCDTINCIDASFDYAGAASGNSFVKVAGSSALPGGACP